VIALYYTLLRIVKQNSILTTSRAEEKVYSFHNIRDIEKQLWDYFNKWIPSGGFVSFLAEEDGEIFSTAFLSIVERPPRTARSYLIGTVYNVFTYPKYRRKGIATKVMQALLKEAELLDIASVDLLSTEEGKFLYEKLGFEIPNYTSMRIKIGVTK